MARVNHRLVVLDSLVEIAEVMGVVTVSFAEIFLHLLVFLQLQGRHLSLNNFFLNMV